MFSIQSFSSHIIFHIIFTNEVLLPQAALLHDVDIPTKKATFGMGCFWSNDSLFGVTPGVIRTRVGYSGGTTKNPHYRSM